jgi:hypothetical protein
MPIRPELRHHYRGPVWREIRERILRRADNQCERCAVPNHETVERYESLPGRCYRIEDGTEFAAGIGKTGESVRASEMPPPDRVSKIVLTIAHLNHDPSDNRDENLAALCQWCHNHHDVEFRQANARKTRVTRKDAGRPLFAEAAAT